MTDDELWDLVDKWRGYARNPGPHLSDNPDTAYAQALNQAAEELADAILDAEDRND